MADSPAERQRRYRETNPTNSRAAKRRWRARNQLHLAQYDTLRHARKQVEKSRTRAEEAHA